MTRGTFFPPVAKKKAFSDYQRQLWDPLSVPVGLDMNDVGYARGGAGIDSAGSGDGLADATGGEGGEWHFHVFGETVGLFALDVRQGSAGLQVGPRVLRESLRILGDLLCVGMPLGRLSSSARIVDYASAPESERGLEYRDTRRC